MKHPYLLFSAIICFSLGLLSLVAHAASDYSDLNKAVSQFLATMDQLSKDVPETQDAEGAAKVIEAWAGANVAVATAMQDFLQKNPNEMKLAKPPPEFAAAYAALSQLRVKYASLIDGTITLGKRFRGDIRVSMAMRSFRNSLDVVKKMEAPDLVAAGNIFRELGAVETAMDLWAIEHNKKPGDLPKPEDLVPYFKAGTRLHECAERGLIFDSLGNPIVIPSVGTRPSVSSQTFNALSTVAPVDFWKPYTIR